MRSDSRTSGSLATISHLSERECRGSGFGGPQTIKSMTNC
jgi:hypothetical protein